MSTAVLARPLAFADYRSYAWALAFAAGNVILPQLVHALPSSWGGGPVWLPLFFFTLVGAYRFGWATGLATAMFSPCLSHLLSGMPSVEVLPSILARSLLLAVMAVLVAQRLQRISWLGVTVAATFGYLLGFVATGLLSWNWAAVVDNAALGVPGLFVQIVLGFLAIRLMAPRAHENA